MITKNYIAKGEGADRFEKVPVQIYDKPSEAVKAVAREIADLIRTNTAKSEKCVLGLATGSSPIKLYQELVRMHKEEGLSFKNVITFNLDEYLPMPKECIVTIILCTIIYSITLILIPKTFIFRMVLLKVKK